MPIRYDINTKNEVPKCIVGPKEAMIHSESQRNLAQRKFLS